MDRIVPLILFDDKSILFIEVQTFQDRQSVRLTGKIESELLRNQSFRLDKILRIVEFFKSTENDIIRQIMHIFLFHYRVVSQ